MTGLEYRVPFVLHRRSKQVEERPLRGLERPTKGVATVLAWLTMSEGFATGANKTPDG